MVGPLDSHEFVFVRLIALDALYVAMAVFQIPTRAATAPPRSIETYGDILNPRFKLSWLIAIVIL